MGSVFVIISDTAFRGFVADLLRATGHSAVNSDCTTVDQAVERFWNALNAATLCVTDSAQPPSSLMGFNQSPKHSLVFGERTVYVYDKRRR